MPATRQFSWRGRPGRCGVSRLAWSTDTGSPRRGALRAGEREFTAILPPDTAARVPAAARTAVLTAADQLLLGEWEVLGVVRTDLAQPDWFRDPVTGRRSPADRYAFRINHRSEEQTGNVKQVWEISRLQHLTLLATAWFLTHDEQYARRVADQLRSWWRENPFLSGVHWTSGIEIGIRLISLAWIRRLLDDWPGVAGLFERDELAVRQIRWHQQYLAAFRSRGSSANNHVIAEAAGQLVASCAFPWFPRERALAAAVRPPARARAGPQHLPVRHRPRACLRLPVLHRGTRAARGRRGGGNRPSAEPGLLAAALRDGRQRRGPARRAIAAAPAG